MKIYHSGSFLYNPKVISVFEEINNQNKEANKIKASILTAYTNSLSSVSFDNILNKNSHRDAFFLDCGAYTAFVQNKPINLDSYIKFVHKYKNKKDITVYAALDVIGDPKKSYENYLEMLKQDLNPLPCLHFGEDINYLKKYEKYTNYIGLGGAASVPKKQRIIWFDHIFKHYPDSKYVHFHGYGIMDIKLINRYPWKSVDSTSCMRSSLFGGGIFYKGNVLRVTDRGLNVACDWKTPAAEAEIKKYCDSYKVPYNEIIKDSTLAASYRLFLNVAYFEKIKINSPTIFKLKPEKKMKGFFV